MKRHISKYPTFTKRFYVSNTMRSFCIKILIITCLTFQILSCSRLGKDEIAKVNFELYGDFGSEQSELLIFKAGGIKKARLIKKNWKVVKLSLATKRSKRLVSF